MANATISAARIATTLDKRGYPGGSPEGSEVIDDGRSRSSSSEDALSTHPPHPGNVPSRNESAREPIQLAASVAVDERLLEAIARRTVELLRSTEAQATSPWLDFNGALSYLGFTRAKLYKLTAAKAIPFRKKENGQELLFHRDELDQWLKSRYPQEGWLP